MIPEHFRFVFKQKMNSSIDWPLNTDPSNNYANVELSPWKFDSDGTLNYGTQPTTTLNLLRKGDLSIGGWAFSDAFNNVSPKWQGAFCVFGVAHDMVNSGNENSVLCFLEWPQNTTSGDWPLNNASGNPGVDPETDLPLVSVNQITADGGNAVYKEVTFEI